MDEEAFLAAIRAMPNDQRTRLVYADWLDENGQPEKAEFLRLQNEQLLIAARLVELHQVLDSGWLIWMSCPRQLVNHNYPPAKKIMLIKLVRELTGMGLAECKAFVEQPLPIRVPINLTDGAAEVCARFEPHATVTLEPSLFRADGSVAGRRG